MALFKAVSINNVGLVEGAELRFICWSPTTDMRFHSPPWLRHKSRRHNKVGSGHHYQISLSVSFTPGTLHLQGRFGHSELFFFCWRPFVPFFAGSGGLISRSWHCYFQIFMRSLACEGNIPLNWQLPANAQWLIWIWGEGNYAAISLNLKPRFVCEMIVQYGLLMAFHYAGSIYKIILGYSP